MRLLLVALLAALPSMAAGLTCALLPEIQADLIPAGFGPSSFIYFPAESGMSEYWRCEDIALVQLDANGPAIAMKWSYFYCENDKWRVDDTARVPLRMTCVSAPAGFDRECEQDYVLPEGITSVVPILPDYKYCPENRQSILEDGTKFSSITCAGIKWIPDQSEYHSYFDVKLTDGTIVRKTLVNYFNFRLSCGDVITTTTTTTTVKPDTNPTAAQLWNVNYYYNYGVGVHAFCADSTCISAIQKNGIGYDMVNGWGLLGKAVRESAIAAVRDACPTGSQNLRNLGFTKSGNKYLHNFSGNGLKQGWVSIVSGSCGAKSPIKRWKSRYTDDMMYGVNLEWNTWYKGMVQDGGKVLFYMWE